MSQSERILVMAHAHPDLSLGGGEIAAYNLFNAYRQDEGVAAAWFLARADLGAGVTGEISLRREDEYLWQQASMDNFRMKARDQASLTGAFADLLRALRPTVVHAHHYLHLGLEFLRVIKAVDPTIRIYLTLHEFLAICLNDGQMIKAGSFKLCEQSSLQDCHRCFPDKTPADFWLRKHYFQRHFDLVDGFISPSEFLRQRYITWGIPSERIVMIENGQAISPKLPPRKLAANESRNRFAFFGQINPYKGIDLLLESLMLIPTEQRQNLLVQIHGANLHTQSIPFQEKIAALRAPLEAEGVLQWVGPYQPHELHSRMQAIDWVLVPSIWWENSPMVIQEAFVCGRPVIASDIGGMAEKVKDGVNGLSVAMGNRLAWSTALQRAAAMTDDWDLLTSGIRAPLSYGQCADAHLQVFTRMVSRQSLDDVQS
ncbi:glycosyltransferase family 4 protein [Methylobacillus flagellatus]|uniref:glycosyltransferase family 4 protein n=1 Tax=Methylobacillus flagellatus TaxID=405 RepID=UPI0010F6B2ED|nr:glycosyltransferase family 4 protein [Methylobacillus flagellatus]